MKSFFLILFSVSILLAKAQNSPDSLHNTAQDIDAHYPGGALAWMRFLNKTLHYPDDAVNNNIEVKIIVEFVVNTDSTLSDVHAISGPEKGGFREEAVHVIIASKKWAPAMHEGRLVKSFQKVPIQFKMSVQ